MSLQARDGQEPLGREGDGEVGRKGQWEGFPCHENIQADLRKGPERGPEASGQQPREGTVLEVRPQPQSKLQMLQPHKRPQTRST